ncbi:MAG TPA: adenylate/guanylate cyclase domain-containing protein [Pirellulales bacterium]|jgi:adenylate cyclase|nr:adenylate/guanylate cyclase domain-containing protein [Pirellulales bacterium]
MVASHVSIYRGRQLLRQHELTQPLEIGRQRDGEPLLELQHVTDGDRLAIAPVDDRSMPRSFLRLVPTPQGVELRNLHRSVAVRLEDGGLVQGEAAARLHLPACIVHGEYLIRVEAADPSSVSAAELNALPSATVAPAIRATSLGPLPQAPHGPSELLAWFQAVTALLGSAISSNDFFEHAARGVVELVHLDAGAVMLRQGGSWTTAAQHAGRFARSGFEPAVDWRPSRKILGEVFFQRRTMWQVPSRDITASMLGLQAVVAAPILDRSGEVLGVLYGDRRSTNISDTVEISPLEAQLVETLACGVAAGIARLKEEQALLAAQIRFEQFFTPELSRSLAVDPGLLEGRDAQVTILFCDIRGFSRLSEVLGSARTVEWISDTMSALSDCVVEHEGVLVDYIGDELIAMWGAPVSHSNDAQRACSAALAMLKALPAVNERWAGVLGEPMHVGIGINTGTARVGNVGTARKFKYGPLGPTVNLASRVEGATKYLKIDLLITAATRAQLPASFATRRLGSVRVVNIAEPVELFELCEPGESWDRLRDEYEQALALFDAGQNAVAAEMLTASLVHHPSDGPTHLLLARCGECAPGDNPGEIRASKVWILPGK